MSIFPIHTTSTSIHLILLSPHNTSISLCLHFTPPQSTSHHFTPPHSASTSNPVHTTSTSYHFHTTSLCLYHKPHSHHLHLTLPPPHSASTLHYLTPPQPHSASTSYHFTPPHSASISHHFRTTSTSHHFHLSLPPSHSTFISITPTSLCLYHTLPLAETAIDILHPARELAQDHLALCQAPLYCYAAIALNRLSAGTNPCRLQPLERLHSWETLPPFKLRQEVNVSQPQYVGEAAKPPCSGDC